MEKWLRRTMEDVEVRFTTARGSATDIVRSAVEAGADDVTIVGGDGTVNEAVNGLVKDDALVRTGVRLTIVPVGSGCDYAKTLGLPAGLESLPRILASDRFREVDIGRAVFRNMEGSMETRYFANILEAGAGGAVVDKVNRSSKVLGGRVAFMWAIFTTLPSYKNRLVEVTVDDEVVAREKMNSVIVANGRYYGSGLRPAPRAEVDDGLFDVVLFGDIGLGEALRNLGKLRRGEHIHHPKVDYFRGSRVSVDSDEIILAEMDGELVGTLPMEVTILHRLLKVRVVSS
jgi:YegS/Rv2252/BmrU family lipid kinase